MIHAIPPVPAILRDADTSVRPQDDFYRYVNGKWLATVKIPPDRGAVDTFEVLDQQSEKDVRGLLEDAAKHLERNPPGSGVSPEHLESWQIGTLYGALMDLPAIDRAGLKPLSHPLTAIDRIHALGDVARTMGELELDSVSGPVDVGVMPDPGHPQTNAVGWDQGGLGLPDRDNYLATDPRSEAMRAAYLAYLTRLNELAGVSDALDTSKAVMAFETALAKIQWTRVEERDPLKTYNPTPRDRWTTADGRFPWATFADAVHMPGTLGAVVGEPSYFQAFSALAAETPLSTWRAYLRDRLLDEYAADLPAGFRQASFEFHDEEIYGIKAMPPRWRHAVYKVDDVMGEVVGKQYVARYFPPQAKAQALELVHNLIAAYRARMAHEPWMAPSTRQAALTKLAKLRIKIGYPDRWRSYRGLVVQPDDAAGDVLAANHFDFLRDMRDAGKPVDHTRWGMTPQTVNAYYDPVDNEIVFPAAILQPPFFDPNRDAAYNYGAIGAVIGHEISHGFDDEGRHYDASGQLRDWWTPADAKEFQARAAALVRQYDAYEPLPGIHINGKLTIGENIADLGGLTISLDAYHRSLDGKPAPVIDGLTGDQRYFLSFARIWRSRWRPALLRTELQTDPHSPGRFRADTVANLEAFYKAFDVKPGDKMYRAPADRVRIW